MRDRPVIDALNEIVAVEVRWGFWKCFDRLRHIGRRWNHKRVHRVYCAMNLNQKRKGKKRVPKRERQSMVVIPKPNAVWAIDFMHDRLYDGRPFRTLNVLDEAHRGALGIEAAVSIPALRVVRVLGQLIELHGKPTAIRCDNGTELTSQVFTDWCRERGIEIRYIQLASPTRMPSSSGSTGPIETRSSTSICFTRSPRFKRSPIHGSSATTKSGRTMGWEACRQLDTETRFSRHEVRFRTVYLTGKLTDTPAYIENFSGKFRDECLNEHWFTSLPEARILIEAWRIEYSIERPHSSIGDATPAEFAQRWLAGEGQIKSINPQIPD